MNVVFIPNNPLGRHTGAGRYPAIENAPQSGQNQGVVPLRGEFVVLWIPACAGMTQFFSNGLSGLNPLVQPIVFALTHFAAALPDFLPARFIEQRLG